jgi:hypothetical protein
MVTPEGPMEEHVNAARSETGRMRRSWSRLRSVLAVAIWLSAAGAAEAASESPRYSALEALRDLDCIENWAQLCSQPRSTLDVEVGDDLVVFTPWDGPAKYRFRITGRAGARLNLLLEACEGMESCTGLGLAATLVRLADGDLVYDGPDIHGLADGQVRALRLELVATDAYRRRHQELEHRLVPGGKCSGLMIYEPMDRGTCIYPKTSAGFTRADAPGGTLAVEWRCDQADRNCDIRLLAGQAVRRAWTVGRSPNVRWYGSTLVEIRTPCGTPCSTSTFYSPEHGFSKPIEFVLAVRLSDGLALSAGAKVVEVVDIFRKDGGVRGIVPLNFSPAITTASVVERAAFVDREHVFVRFHSGPDRALKETTVRWVAAPAAER